MKVCKICKAEKATTEFNKCKSNADGLHSYCRECQHEQDRQYRNNSKQNRAAYDKQYRAAHEAEIKARKKEYPYNHREVETARQKRWAVNHPEQRKAARKESKRKWRDLVMKNGGSYTKEQLHECLAFFGYCCAYSGEPLPAGYHLDHVVPLSKGGTNVIHNIVPCIGRANTTKRDADWETWYIDSPYFSQERYEKIKRWIG